MPFSEAFAGTVTGSPGAATTGDRRSRVARCTNVVLKAASHQATRMDGLGALRNGSRRLCSGASWRRRPYKYVRSFAAGFSRNLGFLRRPLVALVGALGKPFHVFPSKRRETLGKRLPSVAAAKTVINFKGFAF